MKILITTDPKTFSEMQAPVAAIAETALGVGCDTLSINAAQPLLVHSLNSLHSTDVKLQTVGRENADASLTAAIAEFEPNVLLCLTTGTEQNNTALSVEQFLSSFLVIYTLHVGPEKLLHLIDVKTKKLFKIEPDDFARLINIMQSVAVQNTRGDLENIDTNSPVFSHLARAEIELRRYASVLPYRASELCHNPKIITEGTLESLADEEIVLDNKIWIKGWIDWDEKRFSHLVVKMRDQETRLDIQDFRADKLNQGKVENPRNFGAVIDVSLLFSSHIVTIYVEDKQGNQFEWCVRKIWISHDFAANSVTPLITGQAEILEENSVKFSVHCDTQILERVVAWQEGACIGRWEGAPCTALREETFAIYPVRRAGALIHLHLHLKGRTPISWLCLSQATQEPVSFPEIDHHKVIENDRLAFTLDAGPDARPVSVYLDGKLHQIANQCSEIAIDLHNCMGAVLVEAIDKNGNAQSWRLWRHCRDAADGRATLPAFVLPPQTKDDIFLGRRRKTPNLLLLRQASAPTDELYLLSALEEIAQDREFTLEIVDLREDDTSEDDRERLLADGTFVVISRYLTSPWIEAISRRRTRLGQIFYIIDDDLTLAENDTRMPGGYRRRMIGVAHSEFQTLMHLSSRFLVTSEFMKNRFASAKTDLVTPPYIVPAKNLDHLKDLSEIRIEYHGTQVHRFDLDAIASALIWLHDAYPQVTIRTYMGKFAPKRFKNYKRIEIVPDIPWKEYKAVVAASPAHIALAPMLETPYNKAKSFVKVMDIARLGAVGLYSRREPYSSVIQHGETGLLLENDAMIWCDALAWLVENPAEIARMARSAQEMTRKLGDINSLRDYWEARIFGNLNSP